MPKSKSTKTTTSTTKSTANTHARRTPMSPPGGFRGNRKRYPNGGKIDK
jgi:hypothetical protein